MTCAIIEDDRHTVNMLTTILSESFEKVTVVGHAPSVVKGLTLLNTTKPDFIFLDVNLKDGQSFEILENLESSNSKIIFLTSENIDAEKALQFNGVIGFVKKPFTIMDIVKVTNRTLNQIQLEKGEQFNDDYLSKKITFNHKSGDTNELLFIPLKDIIYLESNNNKTYVNTINKEKIKVNKTLKHFNDDFPPKHFFRTHQSFLVNLNFVKRFDNDTYEAVLNNEVYIPVAQNKKPDFIKALEHLNR